MSVDMKWCKHILSGVKLSSSTLKLLRQSSFLPYQPSTATNQIGTQTFQKAVSIEDDSLHLISRTLKFKQNLCIALDGTIHDQKF